MVYKRQLQGQQRIRAFKVGNCTQVDTAWAKCSRFHGGYTAATRRCPIQFISLRSLRNPAYAMTILNMFYKVAVFTRSIVTGAALVGPLVVYHAFVKVKRVSVRIALAWTNLASEG